MGGQIGLVLEADVDSGKVVGDRGVVEAFQEGADFPVLVAGGDRPVGGAGAGGGVEAGQQGAALVQFLLVVVAGELGAEAEVDADDGQLPPQPLAGGGKVSVAAEQGPPGDAGPAAAVVSCAPSAGCAPPGWREGCRVARRAAAGPAAARAAATVRVAALKRRIVRVSMSCLLPLPRRLGDQQRDPSRPGRTGLRLAGQPRGRSLESHGPGRGHAAEQQWSPRSPRWQAGRPGGADPPPPANPPVRGTVGDQAAGWHAYGRHVGENRKLLVPAGLNRLVMSRPPRDPEGSAARITDP